MKNAQILFVTGNKLKFLAADEVCRPAGIQLLRQELDMAEVQASEGITVATHKAEQAYAAFKKPVLISDDSWYIPGLNGFPGPYMKYINDWFTPDNYLALFRDLKDRRIILEQVVVYQDERGQQVFRQDIQGTLLNEVRGSSPFPHLTLTSFDEGAHSAAEVIAAGQSSISHHKTAWHIFVDAHTSP